jgi:hypothetical protein
MYLVPTDTDTRLRFASNGEKEDENDESEWLKFRHFRLSSRTRHVVSLQNTAAFARFMSSLSSSGFCVGVVLKLRNLLQMRQFCRLRPLWRQRRRWQN